MIIKKKKAVRRNELPSKLHLSFIVQKAPDGCPFEWGWSERMLFVVIA